MANQEGVKIVITAEDRFTETMKKIDAYTKIFGETAKNTERQIAALEKEMVRLVANGIDPASAKIKEMKASYDRLSQSLNNGSLKKTNQNFTALALVVQDLPYGFRGIQNNLPALLGGIAGVGGAAYLAFSGVIAVLTAVDSGLISFGNNVKLATDYNKEFASSLADEQVKLDSLYRTATNSNKSMSDRIAAAKKLKDEYPQLLSNFSAEEIAAGKAAKAYDKLSQAVIRYAKAEASQKAIKEIVTKQIDNDIKIAEKELELKAANASADKRQTEIDKKSLVYAAGTINLERVRASTIQDNIDKLKSQNKVLADQRKQYENIYDANVTFELDDVPKPTKNKAFEERIKAIKEANKAETDAYIQTLDERGQKEYKAGLDLANNLEKMRLAGYTDSTTYYTAYRAEMANIGKYYDNKQLEEQKKQNEKELKESISFAKNQADIIKTQSDVEQKLFNGNLRQQQDALKANMAKLAVLAANTFDPQVAQVYLDMFDKLNAKLTGLGENWDKTARQINSVIQDFIVSSFSLLGESLGKALAGEDVDILNSFAILIADALINVGKSLIEYATMVGLAMTLFSNPLTWPAALAAGIAAVAAGAFLKSQLSKKNNGGDTPKFANGGIVSGPTLGLMGEYPGARSNPEVIAPLDKLKGLIGGGGGGTLTARISGNDLLILMNKASRTNSTTF